jgi:hypothetical protein
MMSEEAVDSLKPVRAPLISFPWKITIVVVHLSIHILQMGCSVHDEAGRDHWAIMKEYV